MLELALATPEIGAVNFNILRSFLYEIIKHLDVREKVILVTEDGQHRSTYDAIRDVRSSHSFSSPVEPGKQESEPDTSPTPESPALPEEKSETPTPTPTPSPPRFQSPRLEIFRKEQN